MSPFAKVVSLKLDQIFFNSPAQNTFLNGMRQHVRKRRKKVKLHLLVFYQTGIMPCMRVTIIGTGFVGVVSSAVFASFGNKVWGLDVSEEKIAKLRNAEIPFFEPGLKELVLKGVGNETLHFTTSYKEAISDAEVILIAVGTPSASDGQADLKYVYAAAESLAPFLQPGAIVAVKSTVPPGTCDEVEKRIRSKTNVPFFCASLPEFLREGSAVHDTLNPDRVVIGATDPEVVRRLTELHAPLNAPVLVMKPASAQMCKYAGNAYLATRITFINQIANLCEVNGADIEEVIKGIGFDKRIGSHYWYPGPGYGGSCFPKDVKELAAYAKAVGQARNLMVKVSELNEERIPQLLAKYEKMVGGWQGKRIGVLGLSFKPNTDDVREAPSTRVLPRLVAAGAVIQAYDPMAKEAFVHAFPDLSVEYKDSINEVLEQADVVFVLTEWGDFQTLSVKEIVTHMKPKAFFFDTRNIHASHREELRKLGIQYIGIGVQ